MFYWLISFGECNFSIQNNHCFYRHGVLSFLSTTAEEVVLIGEFRPLVEIVVDVLFVMAGQKAAGGIVMAVAHKVVTIRKEDILTRKDTRVVTKEGVEVCVWY